MSMIGSYRMLNALENGLLSGAQLETLLATQRYEDEFVALVESRITLNRIISGVNAFSALEGSASALALVAASRRAMGYIAENIDYKLALYNSDPLLGAVAADTGALATLRAAAQYSVVTTASGPGTTSRAISGLSSLGTYIVLGASTSDSTVGATITVSTRESGSSRPATHVTTADSVSSTLALGIIACPLVAPYTAVSTDGSTQTFSFGLLRCDV